MRLSLRNHVVQYESGADNIRYIQYYSIMVALASIVHNSNFWFLITNQVTGCELSALWGTFNLLLFLMSILLADE